MNELQRLKEQRATILAAVKELLARAKARPEGEQDLTAEEAAKVDEQYAEFDKLGSRLGTLERQSTLERAEAQLAEATRRTAPPQPGAILEHAPRPDYSEAVRAWMLRGHKDLSPELQLNAQRVGLDLSANAITVRFTSDGVVGVYSGEPNDRIRRDVLTTTGSSAMVQWREFTSEYDKALLFRGRARELVRVLRTGSGVGLPIPIVDDTANEGEWLAEAGTVTNTDPTLSSQTLGAFKLSSKKVPISIEALQDDQVVMNTVIPMILGERVGNSFNRAIVNGTGTTQPRGILLDATASGVVIAGTVASPTYTWDNWLDLKTQVDVAYRNAPPDKRGFLVHDTVFRSYRKLKDSQTRYYADPFQPGPGFVDGEPVHFNNHMPTVAANAKVLAYGDFSRYWWREVMDVTFYRLNEIAILDGKIVFLAFARADGRLINTAAVKTLAAPAT